MPEPRPRWLDSRLFIVVALVVGAILTLLTVNLFFQYSNYSLGISVLFREPDAGDHVMAITYSRAWDFAVVKTSSLFISFVLIFTGALYVLRAGESKIAASATKGDFSGSIQLTSPGLALAVMGVGLVCFTLANDSDITVSEPAGRAPVSEANEIVKPEADAGDAIARSEPDAATPEGDEP